MGGSTTPPFVHRFCLAWTKDNGKYYTIVQMHVLKYLNAKSVIRLYYLDIKLWGLCKVSISICLLVGFGQPTKESIFISM